ncbi:VCBS domain-containing protein, partial [Salipiger marinus]
TLTDRFTVTTAGGTTQTVTVTLTGINDAAVIAGGKTGSVTEDSAVTNGALTTGGTLTVSDTDTGEAVFVAQAATAGSYGSFTLGTDGTWSYAADNSQAAIQALGTGDTLTDRFTVTTAGGDTETVTVTITGTDDLMPRSSRFSVSGMSAVDEAVRGTEAVNSHGFDNLTVGAPGVSHFEGASSFTFDNSFTDTATSDSTDGDEILVNQGADTLIGGSSDDRLQGGARSDRFVVEDEAGTVTILDFDGGEGDRIDLSAFGIADFAAAEVLISPQGPGGHDTRIELDADTVVVLEDVSPSALVASNLIL